MIPRTVRLRLTLLYGALFAVSGLVLLTITYLLVKHTTQLRLVVKHQEFGRPPGLGSALPDPDPYSAQRALAEEQRAEQLHNLLIQSTIALAIMTVASIALGWLVAGRVLRPLRTMTTTIQQISARNVHERLAIGGPRDELKDLADTVDGLLGRLETALDSHRRFVANAAHELRTPLTLERALLEETLTDGGATVSTFRATFERMVQLSDHQARLLESLLTLAGSERAPARRDPCDLAALSEQALLTAYPKLQHRGLRVGSGLSPALASGDPALLERLVANLLDNAADYNVPGGRVEVSTCTEADRAILCVTNTGPKVPPEQVDRLFEPFQRLGERTSHDDDHHGLGLSIVRAIATAHDATLTARANPAGGLTIKLAFPANQDPAPIVSERGAGVGLAE